MIFADLHCDTLTVAEDLAHNDSQVNLPDLAAAGCRLQCFAAFVRTDRSADPFAEAMRDADLLKQQIARYPQWALPVLSAADVRLAQDTGRVGCMLTVEEGAVVGDSLDNLAALYAAGARMMTLTWNFDNRLGHPNVHLPHCEALGAAALYEVDHRPLTLWGRQVVEAMDELGMIVDVSHLGDGGFWDLLQVSRRPVVASHSNARAVCGVTRNLTDEMIAALAAHGGVVGLNFCPDFLSLPNRDVLDMAVRHASHIWQVGGEDVLALGTDFDGITPMAPLDHCRSIPLLAEALCRVMPSGVVDKMMWHNAFRVLSDVCR